MEGIRYVSTNNPLATPSDRPAFVKWEALPKRTERRVGMLSEYLARQKTR